MKQFLIQIKIYGYATIEADSWDDAKKRADEMCSREFDMSKDGDIDVLDEIDDNGCPIDEEE